MYIADFGTSRIRKVSNGIITTVAGGGQYSNIGENNAATNVQLYNPEGVAVDAAGNIYIADSGNRRICRVSNGVITTINAALSRPSGVAIDPAGNVYVSDRVAQRVDKILDGYFLTTLAGNGAFVGDGGPATSAQFIGVGGAMAMDSGGNLYFADTGNSRVRKVWEGLSPQWREPEYLVLAATTARPRTPS